MTEPLPFRAHARLLTMLGDQLIKNERIALVELVKNAYDADATLVTVDFVGFGDDYSVQPESAVVITDNGTGMTEEVVRTAWMNPATPSKAIAKDAVARTPRGRVLQGEKGIGRFATFKLGTQVSVVTRAESTPTEITLLVDISGLDENAEDSRRLEYYLDDVTAIFDKAHPTRFVGQNGDNLHGTQLEIRGLRAQWSEELVTQAFADLDRMQPQLWNGERLASKRSDFEVRFLRDGEDLRLGIARGQEFQDVLERAVLRVTDGRFDSDEKCITFTLNDREITLPLDGSDIRGLRRFRTNFQRQDGTWADPACGSFEFEFYVFDFGVSAPARHWLDREDKDRLKEHRIYLYRDGIRVYPYGDRRDDWLEVDAIRGTESARSMFSNDQTVGVVSITQAGNPLLRDKTNREGLLDVGNASQDFVAVLQTILAYLRAKPYEQYAAANRRAKEKSLRGERFDKHIRALRQDSTLPERALQHLDSLETAVLAERELSALQLARTEQLAGVGLSVETASHDLITAGIEAFRIARQIVDELQLLDLRETAVYAMATAQVLRLQFITARFQDVQGLFVSTRQKPSKMDIVALMRRVRSMYGGLHAEEDIKFEIDDSSRLEAVSNEAAILQCFINLVDNATYWLMTSSHHPREIRVFTSGGDTLHITDTGPGVAEQDEPYIFEPFYSGKGETGKGLGLYIARQNGVRSGFSVGVAHRPDERYLSGATFVVKFEKTGEGS